MAMAPRRLTAVRGHLQPADTVAAAALGEPPAAVDAAKLRAFMFDPAWAGRPVWMLNVLNIKDRAEYAAYGAGLQSSGLLERAGARVMLSGYARTVVGRKPYNHVAVVEYRSPETFAAMVGSAEYRALDRRHRRSGLAEQYLIPIRPGWFKLGDAAPPPAAPLGHVPAGRVWATPSGLVGAAGPGARVGETAGTRTQAEDFCTDPAIGATNMLWHLNLLQFAGGDEATYMNYARAAGRRGGFLGQYGARST
jgi:uncharacterized protein (DUF1330 family)